MIDPIDVYKEVEWFLRFKNAPDDARLEIEERKLERLERLIHADKMIRDYSYSHKKGRQTHKDKFDLDNRLVINDFMVAFYALGKDAIYNRESNKRWALQKIETAICRAIEMDDLKGLSDLLKRYYEFADLDKNIIDTPDFSKMELKEIRVALHPKVIEMKQKPDVLEASIKELLMPKKKILADDAQIVNDGKL